MPQHLIGILSDTHGLLRPEVVQALKDVETIIHAGDVGAPHILDTLRTLAPLYPVRGNIDKDRWAENLPKTQVVHIDAVSLYVLHNIHELDLDPKAAGFQAVIFGHSHQPMMEQRNEILFLNPGSAGPRRFKLPICLMLLEVDGQTLKARLVEIKG